ncbi:hypothetical protein [Thauera sp.]|uniref:hypothetical protein n=1 Tax=Thauera sp. TaxID=1905334 RepID=UPI002BE8DF57|nr:hypothetical protein [Thauera sp.]HRP25402.1 hypothetical protein [Thauera sp.]
MTKLTDAEAERLAMLAEEAAEVVQIVGKILRHGYDSYHPLQPDVLNRELLDDELRDLLTVAKRMVGEGDVEGNFLLADHNAAWKRKLRYTHHQEVALTGGDGRG